MQKRLNKYFWDGTENLSPAFRLKRIFEYASFPDMISIPFEEVKNNIASIDIDKLRASEKRKHFLKFVYPYIRESESWEEMIMKSIKKRMNNEHRL